MLKKKFVYLMLAGLTALSLMLAACGDPTSTVAPAAAPTKAAGTAVAPASAAQVATDMVTLTTKLATVSASLTQNNVKQAQDQFKDFDETWDKVEDGVKSRSADAYKDIEDKIGNFENAIIKPTTPDVEKGKQAVKDLTDTITKFATTLK